MKVERRVHPVYEEWHQNWYMLTGLTGHADTPIMGKYQYIYSSKKGEISLVEFPEYFGPGTATFWEIYCLSGNLFEDVERYDTKDEAENRIKELLER